MGEILEIRWHGRAQQGVVTAAKVLGETAMKAGKHVQAFPEFGPERMGAPVKSYNRISDEEIRLHCQVTHPKYVLIVDPTLISSVDVTQGTPDDAVFIVNTRKSAAEMRGVLGLADGVGKVYTVDASHISQETIGREMPNTPTLGALAKATGVVTLEHLIDNFRENYSKKYSEKVIEGNASAMTRGYEEVVGEE